VAREGDLSQQMADLKRTHAKESQELHNELAEAKTKLAEEASASRAKESTKDEYLTAFMENLNSV